MSLETLLAKVAAYTPAGKVAENGLLLCCLPGDEQREQWLTELLQRPLDWSYLLEMADDHGLIPLLNQQLTLTPTHQLVPVEVREALRQQFQRITHYNFSLTAELLKVLELLKAEEIPVLAFKGPVLSQMLYNHLSLRQFSDLDILVPPPYLERVTQLLLKGHYQPSVTLTLAQQSFYRDRFFELSFEHPQKPVSLDVHWALLPQGFSFSPTPELIWQNLSQMEIAGRSVSTLSPECLLLYLCAHNAKESWFLLRFIYDLAQLLQVFTNLDWDWIEAHAGQLGTSRMLDLGLYLAQELLDAKLPVNICSRISRQSEIKFLASEVQHRLFRPCRSTALARFEDPKIYLQTMARKRDQLWYWLDVTTTPTLKELAIGLPPGLMFLYYPIRLLRLSWKYSFAKFFARPNLNHELSTEGLP